MIYIYPLLMQYNTSRGIKYLFASEIANHNKTHLHIFFIVYFNNIPPYFSNAPLKTSDVIAINFIRMFREGPLVSFNGSPTVSPITAALCISDRFPWTTPSIINLFPSMYFLALSQAPPALENDMAN